MRGAPAARGSSRSQPRGGVGAGALRSRSPPVSALLHQPGRTPHFSMWQNDAYLSFPMLATAAPLEIRALACAGPVVQRTLLVNNQEQDGRDTGRAGV